MCVCALAFTHACAHITTHMWGSDDKIWLSFNCEIQMSFLPTTVRAEEHIEDIGLAKQLLLPAEPPTFPVLSIFKLTCFNSY